MNISWVLPDGQVRRHPCLDSANQVGSPAHPIIRKEAAAKLEL